MARATTSSLKHHRSSIAPPPRQTTTTSTSTGGSGSSLWHYCTWTKYEPDEDSPAARHGHSLVGYQSKMVLFGGFDGAFSNTYMNDMWLWDVKPYMTVEVTAEDAAAQHPPSDIEDID